MGEKFKKRSAAAAGKRKAAEPLFVMVTPAQKTRFSNAAESRGMNMRELVVNALEAYIADTAPDKEAMDPANLMLPRGNITLPTITAEQQGDLDRLNEQLALFSAPHHGSVRTQTELLARVGALEDQAKKHERELKEMRAWKSAMEPYLDEIVGELRALAAFGPGYQPNFKNRPPR